MKTIITLCLAVFLMAGIQDIKAQTKEETIQWLNDYGTDLTFSYLDNQAKFKGFDMEFLHFEDRGDLKYEDGTRNATTIISEKVSPKDILYQDITTISENSFEYDGESFIFRIKTKPKTVVYESNIIDHFKSGDRIEKEKILRSVIIIIFDSKEQQKDAIRLIKAIMNLAKLSGADPLPKVSENTF